MTTLMKSKPSNGALTIFDHFFNNDFLNWDFEINTGAPHYDIIENDDEYVLELMLPGFNKEDISINIEKDILKINGERKLNEKKNYNSKGSFFGEFNKVFNLPENVNSDKIDASFENGILSIKIPKDEKKKLSKTIEIN